MTEPRTDFGRHFQRMLEQEQAAGSQPLFQDDPFTAQARQDQQLLQPLTPAARPSSRAGTAIDGRQRTESITQNFMMDFQDLLGGYKMIGEYIAQEGLSGVGEIARRFPKAVVDSYARWVHAAQRGQFLDLVHDHPLEFLQDVSAPLTIALGGVGGVAGAFGKSAQAAKVARVLNKTANIVNAGDFVLDPVSGVTVLGVRKAGGAIFQNVAGGPKLSPHRMNISDPITESVGLKRRFERLHTQAVNKMFPAEKLAKEMGVDELADFVGVHAGTPGAVKDFIELGPRKYAEDGFGDATGTPGLSQMMADLGDTRWPELDDLLAARSHIERGVERGLKTGMDDDAALRVLEEAAGRKLARLPSKAEWRQMTQDPSFDGDLRVALERYDAYTRDLLRFARDADLKSQDQFEAILRQNEFYTPFLRATKENVAGSKGPRSPRDPLKRFRGSDDPILSPLGSTVLMTHRIMNEAYQNRVLRTLGTVADLDVDGNPIRRVPPPTKAAAHVSMNEAFEAVGAHQIERMPPDSAITKTDVVEANRLAADEAAMDIDFSQPSPIFRPKGLKDLPDNVVSYVEGGERKFLEINDPDIAQAFGSLGIAPDSQLMQMMWPATIPKKMMQAGITMDPSFGAVNMVRDQFMAWIQSNYGYRPVWDWMIGVGHVLGKTQWYSDMRSSNMFMSALVDLDRAKQLRRITDSLQGGQQGVGRFMTKRHWQEVGKNLATNPLYVLQEFSSAAEMGTRLGAARRAYKKLINQGVPPSRARLLASKEGRTVAVDFARVGANPVWQALHSITAFQNAAIQGLARVGNAAIQNPVRFTAKATAAITIPSLLLYMHNMEDPEYAEIPDTEKDLFWHARTPDGRLLRFPKPFEVGLLFGTLPVRVMESMMEDDPSSIPKIRERLLSQFNPLGWPTAMRPIVELIANKNFFFDQPIESPGQQRFLVKDRANAGTSELARILSAWTSVFGKDATNTGKPGDAALSPLEIDHLIYGYTGTLGRRMLELTDQAMHATDLGSGVEPPDPRGGRLARLPLIDRFIGNRNKASQFRTDYFELNEKIQQTANSFANLKKLGRNAEARRFRDEHAFDIRMARKWDRISKRIFTLIGRQKVIRNSETHSPSEKRGLIDQLDRMINELARSAVEERRRLLRRQETEDSL